MAARTPGKSKPADSARASAKGRRASAPTAKTTKSVKTAKTSKTAKTAKAPRGKTASKHASDNATALLVEQNEALRAELENAKARIQQLEEQKKEVINRIDWVIDSLQGALHR